MNFGEVTLQQNGQVLGTDLSQPPARDLYRIERLSKVNLGIIRNRYIEFECFFGATEVWLESRSSDERELEQRERAFISQSFEYR